MIRSDFDISDEEFDKVSKPFVDEIKKYIRDNIIYGYMAFYIATGYNKDALFKGTLSGVFNAALDDMCELDFGSSADIAILKSILQEKYNLLLTSDTNLEIEEIQKQDQN
jgi:hypothetical protein